MGYSTSAKFNSPVQASSAQVFVFGQSVDGYYLVGYRVGTGDKVMILVGGIHAGLEMNGVELVQELRDYFLDHPEAIDPHMTFIFIPLLNPDGQTHGLASEARFNGNNVDLNRNWGCGWSEEAYFRQIRVNAGNAPFSEPETRALKTLVEELQPAVVLSYHAKAGGIFAGNCGNTQPNGASQAMAEIYGRSADYPYEDDFNAYPVTGSAPAWLDSIGVAAADVELYNHEETDFAQNLRGVLAVQTWIIEQNQ